MPPVTRSQSSTPAPAPKTYRSEPALQQIEFPARRRIFKKYGRKSTGSAPARSLRQQTLTQIDYVTQSTPQDPDDLLELPEEPPKSRRPAKSEPNKRRKTLGDTPNSSYQTQTLTQFISKKKSRPGGNEHQPLVIQDSDEDSDDDLDKPLADVGFQVKNEDGQGELAAYPAPKTPKKQINDDREIPSSQPTPFTPILPSTPSQILRRCSPPVKRGLPSTSPLIGRSSNVEAPMPTAETLTNRPPRNLVVQDTFSSSSPLSPYRPDPAKLVTPQKQTIRQPLSELPLPSRELGPESIVRSGNSHPGSGKENRKRRLEEIPDSDAESDSVIISPVKFTPAKPSNLRNSSQTSRPILHPLGSTPRRSEAAPEPELLLELEESTDELDENAPPGTPTPRARKAQSGIPLQSSPSVLEETPQKPRNQADSSPVVPRTVQRHTQFGRRNTQRRTQLLSASEIQRHTQLKESQRISLDAIRSLGPVTDRSDILISIQPDDVELITAGMKDHEFRAYQLPAQVTRAWIHSALPVGEVKYMATVGPAQQPGDIDSTSGVGNAEFNDGATAYKFAHKLMQVFELNNAISSASMAEHGLGDPGIKKWQYISPRIVGRLLGNLRCALFAETYDSEHEDDPLRSDYILGEDEEEESENGDANVTISQELEQQIRSDIESQIQSSAAARPHEVIPATHKNFLPRSKTDFPADEESAVTPKASASRGEFALPALPRSAAQAGGRIQKQMQQPQLPTTPTAIRQTNYIRPSQATTASQASTPAVSPEKPSPQKSSPQKSSVPRPVVESSEPSLSDDIPDNAESPARLPRSRFNMTASQVMMMDSLFTDEVREPPVILDSDDFNDDDDYDDDL